MCVVQDVVGVDVDFLLLLLLLVYDDDDDF